MATATEGGPAILYAAKSSPDERESIPRQFRDAHNWADKEGLEILAGYHEEDVSAYKGDRGKELANAMEHAEMCGAVLVVQHSDRLARGDGMQARHLVEIALWALKTGVRVHCVEDPRTFESVANAAQMGDRNMEDSRRKGSSVSAGQLDRVRKGRHMSKPYGYRLERNAADERVLVPDPDQAPVLRRFFTDTLAGRTSTEICRRLNAERVPPARKGKWHPGTISHILHNPAYAGYFRSGGELVPARHEPLIDMETWRKALALRDARAVGCPRGRPTKGPHLFRKGLLRCAWCGGSIIPRTSDHGKYQTYMCYTRDRDVCACSMPPIKRALVDDTVYAHLTDIALDADSIRAQLEETRRHEITELEALMKSAEREEREAAARLERVKGDYLAGDLNATEWRELRIELEPDLGAAEAEAKRLRERMAEAEQDPLTYIEADVLDAITEIRAKIAKEVTDAEGAAAVRTTLMRLFDGFVLHTDDGVNEGVFTPRWIEPLVSKRVTAGYGEKLDPLLARKPLGIAEKKFATVNKIKEAVDKVAFK